MQPNTDTQPWYKQFWPWFIISLPLASVIAGISTVIIAVENKDDMVVSDYYREGLAYNERQENSQRAKALGLKGNVSINSNQVRVTISPPTANNELQLKLVHPTIQKRDWSIQLSRASNGQYTTSNPPTLPMKGTYQLHLESNDAQWKITEEVTYIPDIDIPFSAN